MFTSQSFTDNPYHNYDYGLPRASVLHTSVAAS